MQIRRELKHTVEFENVYLSYYPKLKRFAQEYVILEAEAENIVQDVFTDLWEKRMFISSHINLSSFLFTSIKNKCIDYLRHQLVVQKTADKLQEEYALTLQMKFQSLEAFDVHIVSEGNIETIIHQAIDALPEKCRQIFIMNKLEGKTQKNIAKELNLSVHTIESQMSIAYKKLKESLKDYTPLLFFLLI